MLTAVLFSASLCAPPPADALTKTQVKKRAGESVQTTKDKWESLTPEQQQQVTQRLKVDAEAAKLRWEAMTPDEQQAAKTKAKAGASKARKRWQKLPD
jgi:TRAP-type C4-dicarboxylate transport system substrate-binding protein